MGTYRARISSLPPAAIVATKAMRVDPRAEPRYAERIPYVVIHGEPGARLVDMVVDPLEVLAIDSPFRINDLYYINKQIIPALQRVFGLVGADLNHWFSEVPRPTREASAKHALTANSHRTRIDYYYLSKHCVVCGRLVQATARLCNQCSENEVAAAIAVISKTSKLEREMQHLVAVSIFAFLFHLIANGIVHVISCEGGICLNSCSLLRLVSSFGLHFLSQFCMDLR